MMKVTVNVECTPEEARVFMGLPDVQPMQQAILQDLQHRMQSSLNALSPEAVLTNWLPLGLQNAGQIQKLFWNQVQNAVNGMTNATTSAMVTFAEKKSADKP